ncbi:MAG: hypothetical protein D8M58_08770 [Calditrichaeota bacterium]|nr:MAG: hypothetical protein DWQ03_17720 [Calditrichota bacterium]MBL1205476.1 hypothetical protein [Calditrichota bacterium]NOG45305.1 hypothetical protein [Calditrichota bacterium]
MNFLYSFFLLPILIVFLHLVSLFSKKLRRPIYSRNRILKDIAELKPIYSASGKKTFIIHTASMGEFEHVKPIIKKLKEKFNRNIIVTFFSPSGYENVKDYPGIDHIFYLPYDFQWLWRKFYKAVNCELLIVSKHDVWPNQVKTAKKLGMQTILLNASLSAQSSRKSFLAKAILSSAYQTLDKIFVISQQDNEQIVNTFSCKNTEVVGDTKFDQVLIRKEAAEKQQLLNLDWISEKTILVFGSLWPQDAEHVLSSLSDLLDKNTNLKTIIVPHQPTGEIISKFVAHFGEYGYGLFSQKTNPENRILIVDKIGLLADMYKHADIAYVGGSFKQGIHNVLEPAIYNIPVIYGPVYKNSFEAKQLYKKGGSSIVNNSEEFSREIQALLNDESLRKLKGQKAKKYATQNIGSTSKILEYIGHAIQ